MKLENEFSVAASLADTWATLLDIERVATCLPGAKIEPGDDDGVYRGAIKMKLGPMTVNYQGTAKLADVDEDTHTASIAVKAREAKGQGTAAAVISNRLERVDDKTRVIAVTDLKITGRQAQFGRGIMEDVASSMMKQFATRLEEEIQSGGAAKAAPAAAGANGAAASGAPRTETPPPSAAPAPELESDEVLDVGNVLANTQMVRYAGIAGAALLLLLAIVALLRGRKQRHSFNIDLKR